MPTIDQELHRGASLHLSLKFDKFQLELNNVKKHLFHSSQYIPAISYVCFACYFSVYFKLLFFHVYTRTMFIIYDGSILIPMIWWVNPHTLYFCYSVNIWQNLCSALPYIFVQALIFLCVYTRIMLIIYDNFHTVYTCQCSAV